ncbi:monooxygenase-like protein [Aspergillus sclerotioniger CBS 115572]|uniref:Monooxygenase-like protein n=1 Tax=Aspergillus sclerotioniger CBS 115572 TaxID=1450535 RepID=A0A317X784_9EURO|nr:monooxygenase-like protein [Aspergillus sclerotioniger CBS 115572]PWY94454.1 monooxygenase-like protein [Aspergillus sclerotioniger CBS 115572]
MLFLCVLCVLCVLPSAHLSYAQQPQKCSKLLTRKEWRTLTFSEKAEWVGAVKCLASIRHERLSLTKDQTVLEGKRSLYDDFSYAHASVEHSVHRNAYFLPWHRWFTYLFDTSLRHTCGYSGPTPYWDWSRDHADLFSSPVFEDSPEYGLGGTGDCDSSPEADCTVTTGAFAPSAGNFELAWPIRHSLRRNLTLITGWYPHEQPQNRTLGPDFVRNLTEQTTGDFFRFQHAMELLHNHVHNFVGGDLAGDCPKVLPEEDCQGMAISFTPNDPLFWLHHAQLDRLWSEWQRHHPSNFAAFSGVPLTPYNMTDPRYDLDAHADYQMPFDVLSVAMTPRMVFDTEGWPLCYQYIDEE